MGALRLRFTMFAAVGLTAFAAVAGTGKFDAGVNRPGAPPEMNRPPVVSTRFLSPSSEISAGEELRFELRVTDPEGDPVSVRLLNPQPGLVFHPVRNVKSPSVTEVRWVVPKGNVERPRLMFTARDERGATATSPVEFDFERRIRRPGSRILTGDVTGDGVADLVGGAMFADAGGVINSGALYVWEGSTSPSASPTATLTVPGANLGDQLGFASEQGIHLVDVTADGTLDIVVGAELADVNGDANTGAIYVFEGGGTLVGPVSPSATLTVLGGMPGDQLGCAGFVFEDVTGDGDVDIVAGTWRADAMGIPNSGAVYVFEGGPSLAGPAVHPLATLHVTGAMPGDRLGLASGAAIRIADVTGDGQPDILAGAQYADIDGIENLGAIHVWRGGFSLAGPLDPDISLRADGFAGDKKPGDQLGFASGQGIQLADVTGDGRLDVVAGAQLVDLDPDLVDVGAIYVWHGGSDFTLDPSPDAVLLADLPQSGDQLGNATGQGIQLADATDDGILDIVAGAMLADEPFGTIENRGSIHVFAGGASLTGTIPATLTLDAGGQVNDRLGDASGQGIQLVDLTGNGRLEIVAAAAFADNFSTPDVGLVYLWSGDLLATQIGLQPPSTILDVGGQPGDRLGNAAGQGVQFADLDGDGLLDLVAGADRADGSEPDSGAIYVWRGGPTIEFAGFPDSILDGANATGGDRLGNCEGQGIRFADIDGDGIDDVVAGAQFADPNGTSNAGAIYVWRSTVAGGGNLPNGSSTEVLTGDPPMPDDRIGSSYPQGFRFADVTDDGIVDIVAAVPMADAIDSDAGRVYVWEGGPFLSSTPSASLESANPSPNAQLGFASRGFLLADLTDDGIPDLVVGAENDDPNGIVNAGSIHFWRGGSSLAGFLFEDVRFEATNASDGDGLGR